MAADSLKILHVDTAPTWRGGQAQVLGLVAGLAARGHEQWLAAPDGPLATRVADLGVPTRRFAPVGDLDLVAAVGLADYARRIRPQVVHLHSARAHATGLLAARASGAKSVVARRVDFEVGRGPLSALKYRLPVDRFVTVSRGIADVLTRGGIPREKVTVIHSGIEVDAMAARVDAARAEGRAKAMRARLRVPESAPLVGAIAALAPHKDHRTLVLAAEIVLAKRPDARFVAAGEGSTRANIADQLVDLGLDDAFCLPGFLDDVPAVLGALDLFVLSSYLEGLGTSVLDAQAAGVPVVATGVGGVPEMIQDCVNGRLVPPRDPAALADAILEALDDPDKARARAAKARETVRAFDLERTIERTESLYRELVGREPRGVRLRVLDFALLALALALPLSIAGTEIALGVATLAWLSTRPWTRAQAPWVRPLAWTTAALAASWLLASATSATPLASLVNVRKLWSIVLVFILADRMREPARARRFVTFTLAAGTVTCAIGILVFAIRHANGEWDEPLRGVFSTAMTTGNVLATLVLAATALVLFARGAESRRWFDRAAWATLVTSMLLTFRRGSYLGFLAGTIVLVGMKKARLLLLVPLLIAVAIVLLPRYGRDRALSIANPTDHTSLGRLSLWKSGAAAFGDRPWTGWGLQDGMPLIERYKRADARFPAGHFHNNIVQIAVTTGSVGLAAYLAWMAVAGLGAWRAFRRSRSAFAAAGVAAWVGFQVAGCFDWSFGDAEVAYQLFAWLGLALGASALTASSASASFTSAAHPPARARSDGAS